MKKYRNYYSNKKLRRDNPGATKIKSGKIVSSVQEEKQEVFQYVHGETHGADAS